MSYVGLGSTDTLVFSMMTVGGNAVRLLLSSDQAVPMERRCNGAGLNKRHVDGHGWQGKLFGVIVLAVHLCNDEDEDVLHPGS